MIALTEQIDIPAPFERLCAWADNFEEEFVRWSPYHIECDLHDGGVGVGDRVRFREIVMGLDYDVTGAVVNALVFKVLFRRKADWRLVRDDMILDNAYLRDILVEGRYPPRIPLDELLAGCS